MFDFGLSFGLIRTFNYFFSQFRHSLGWNRRKHISRNNFHIEKAGDPGELYRHGCPPVFSSYSNYSESSLAGPAQTLVELLAPLVLGGEVLVLGRIRPDDVARQRADDLVGRSLAAY